MLPEIFVSNAAPLFLVAHFALPMELDALNVMAKTFCQLH
jgi:hypothetical protein